MSGSSKGQESTALFEQSRESEGAETDEFDTSGCWISWKVRETKMTTVIYKAWPALNVNKNNYYIALVTKFVGEIDTFSNTPYHEVWLCSQ
jgi:hypothetical protein